MFGCRINIVFDVLSFPVEVSIYSSRKLRMREPMRRPGFSWDKTTRDLVLALRSWLKGLQAFPDTKFYALVIAGFEMQ